MTFADVIRIRALMTDRFFTYCNSWEKQFISDICTRPFLSEKQVDKLRLTFSKSLKIKRLYKKPHVLKTPRAAIERLK